MAKQALITGGTKGIGRAIAVCLAKVGYDLLLTYNTDETTAANLAAALRKDHAVKVDMLQADITQKESIDRIENRLNDSGVKLDALVLNAGTTYRTTFEEILPNGNDNSSPMCIFRCFCFSASWGVCNAGRPSCSPAH